MNINIFIPWHILRLGGLWLHTSLPSRSTLHILAPAKVQWTSKQLKSAYLDFQSFHRRSSKFPAEHLPLLLEWFTPFFIAIILLNSFCTLFWVSSFYLSVNIVVLYQFTVTCIESWSVRSLERKKCMFSRRRRRSRARKEWICERRCQVSVSGVVYMYLRDCFALKPFRDYSLCSVCILPQPAFYS